MYAFLSFLILNLAIFLHELGHAVKMKKYGIMPKKLSIGFKLWKLPTLYKFTLLGIPCELNMIPLGGYVEAPEETEIPHNEACEIFGQGIIVNFCLASVFSFFYLLHLGIPFTLINVSMMIFPFLLLAFPQFSSRFVLPVLGTLFSAALVAVIVKSSNSTETLGGPIEVVHEIIKTNDYLKDVLFFAININLSLGLLNAAPIYPLDGGQIINSYFKKYNLKKASTFFRPATTIFLLCFFGVLIIKDIVKLLF
mgnify:CR=1 FL=1